MSAPGPWTRGVTDSELVAADGTLMALVLASSHSFQTLYIDPTKAKLAHVPEAQSNAQLMMCAPEMLAALEAWLLYDGREEDGPNAGVQMMLDYDHALSLTKDAVAKAKARP